MKSNIYIDMNSIDRDAFRISKRDHAVAGTAFLITPGFDKHSWSERDFHLRSLILSEAGEIICSGFPKFRNYGEDQDDDELIGKLIADGKVLFAEKMDGSCIIRTVIDGVVCLRTRGSMILAEDFHDLVMTVVNEKYPKLMDPTLSSDISLLFEFTAPDNQIILQYEDSRLTCIGAMTYDHSCGLPTFIGNRGLVKNIAGVFGVDPVIFHDIPNDLDQAISLIRSWSGTEGIVVWGQKPDGTMLLIKIKAEEYIRLHSLRYQMSGNKIKKLCWYKGIETEEALKAEMYKLGIDWEFVSFIMDDFNEYIERLNTAKNRIQEVQIQIHLEKIAELPTMKRKVLALKRLYPTKMDFTIGIQSLNKNTEYLNNMAYAYALEIPMNSMKTLASRIKEQNERYGF